MAICAIPVGRMVTYDCILFGIREQQQSCKYERVVKNIFDFRHHIFSYLMVVILAILFILPQCVICGYENGAPIYAIIVMIPMMLVAGGLEEAGWRYILQPELEKKYSFTISTIIVSIIW